MFQTQRDAEITIGIYKRVPVLWRDDPEEIPGVCSFMRMFDMANDSGLFRTRDSWKRDGWILAGNIFVRVEERMLPLYEAKLIHHFDHRLPATTNADGARTPSCPASTSKRRTTRRSPYPRYWVGRSREKSADKPVYDPATLGWTSTGLASRLARYLPQH